MKAPRLAWIWLALVLAPGASAGAPRLEGAHACPDAAGFTCSTLVVPLDHSGAARGTLRLQVAAATKADAPRGVLLFLAGGPGQPAVPIASRLAERLGQATDGYRLVVLDQRGTGAGALDCPALQRAMGSSDLKPPPRGRGPRVRARRSGRSAASSAPTTSSPTSTCSAQALGVERWAIDGVSYGTFVAERYAIAHPQHVDRLVLDSVVPHVRRRRAEHDADAGGRAACSATSAARRASPTSPR